MPSRQVKALSKSNGRKHRSHRSRKNRANKPDRKIILDFRRKKEAIKELDV